MDQDHTVLIDTTIHVEPVKTRKFPLKFVIVLAMIAVVLSCVPFLLSRTEGDRLQNDRREELARMTKLERDKLEHHYKKFVAAPETEQERYRELHAALETDRETRGGELTKVMQDYYAWQKTLSFQEWGELDKVNDPAMKVQVVAMIQKKREAEREKIKEETDKVLRRIYGFGGFSRMGGSSEMLAELTAMLENNLPESKLPDDEIEGKDRYIHVLRASLEQVGPDESWPSQLVLNRLIEGASERSRLRWLKRIPENQRRERLAGMVIMTLFGMTFRESMPTREQLAEYLSTLEPARKRELLRDHRKLLSAARLEFLKKNGERFRTSSTDVRKLGMLMEKKVRGYRMPRRRPSERSGGGRFGKGGRDNRGGSPDRGRGSSSRGSS